MDEEESNVNLSSEDESEADHDISDQASSTVTTKTRHPVWKHFELFKEGELKKAKCQLKIGRRPCKKLLTGWTTTNAMKHLKSNHKPEYVSISNERRKGQSVKKKKSAASSSGQQSLLPKMGVKYLSQHPKQKLITQKLAKAFVSNSLASRLIENQEFREAIAALDEHYDPPSVYLLQKEVHLLFDTMKINMKASMDNVNKIAITADVWTKRGMSESFIGATAHWFDKRNHQRKSATLAIRKLDGLHVAELIYNNICDILQFWDIPRMKVSKVVTDNGSNMVKSFQESFQLAIMQDAGIDDDIELSTSLDSNESPSGAASNRPLETTEYLDFNLEDSFIESDDASIENEIMEFDQEEQMVKSAFTMLDRLSCFAHSLQCAVRDLDKSKYMIAARKSAFKLIESFSHSTTATQILKDKTRKKLFNACRTPWSYTVLALSRLIDLKEPITETTNSLKTIDNLTNTEWAEIERYVKLMQSLADATYQIEGDKYSTLSEVILQLLELEHHLSQMKTEAGFKLISTKLLDNIHERFAYITNSKDDYFEPIYVVATALDPRFILVLTEEQLNKANSEISRLLGNGQSADVQQNASTNTAQSDDPHSSGLSRFKFISTLIQQKQRDQETTGKDSASEEVMAYFQAHHHLPENEDPLTFWNHWSNTYPKLASLAQDILVIPATSAPVERLFSQASIAAAGRRNRLSGDQLQREVMLKANKRYF